ncbi:MAG: metallophosphoesterase family protein [Bosea sp. (in: a-proteobacteria)]
MFTLAHLSDPHLGPLARFQLRDMLGKRITGYVNWRRSRRHVHDMSVLDRIVDDILDNRPDHVACTGDVAHIGLPGEFRTAIAFLDRLGPRDQVSFVPGNHDAYVRSSLVALARDMAPWCASDNGEAGYPWLKQRGNVALIGLSSGVPTAPLIASGRLGAAQIAKAETLLAQAKANGLTRVILIHHPPHLGGAKRGRELTDARAFEAMLGRVGAELVLHGHNHRASLNWREGPEARTPILGVPSASVGPSIQGAAGHADSAAWTLLRIAGEGAAARITAERRGLLPDGTIGKLELIDLSS